MATADENNERVVGVLLQNVQARDIKIGHVHIGDVYQLPDHPALWVHVPPLPNHFIGQDQLVLDLVHRLGNGTSPAVAVHGLPGVGKSAVAVILAHHPKIRSTFSDGVLWAGLGPSGDPASHLAAWAAALDVKINEREQPDEVARNIGTAIAQRKMLLIIDDVWSSTHAALMRCGGPNCKYVLTTRDLAIAREFADAANVIHVLPLSDTSGIELLELLAPEVVAADRPGAQNLATSLGGLPLALRLVGGFLAAPERSLLPGLSEAALKELESPERRLLLAGERLGTPGRQYTLSDTIELSLTYLPKPAVDAFDALGAFAAKPAAFSLVDARTVAQADLSVLALLIGRNLLELNQSQHLSLHQLVADVARTRTSQAARARHAAVFASVAASVHGAYMRGERKLAESGNTFDYIPESPQIATAWSWAVAQSPSPDVNRILADVARLAAFIPFSEPFELNEKIARLKSGLTAAQSLGESELAAAFGAVLAMQFRIQAMVSAHSGHLQQAIQLYDRAINAAQSAHAHQITWSSFFKDHESYAPLLDDACSLRHELADVYLQAGAFKEAIESFAIAAKPLSTDTSRVAQYGSLLRSLAKAHIALKQYADAATQLKMSIARLRAQPADGNEALIESLSLLAICSYNTNDGKEALTHAEEVVSIAMSSSADPASADMVSLPPSVASMLVSSLSIIAAVRDDTGERERARNARKYLFILLLSLFKQHQSSDNRNKAMVLSRFFGETPLEEFDARTKALLRQIVDVTRRLGEPLLQAGDIEEALVVHEMGVDACLQLEDGLETAVSVNSLYLAYRTTKNVDRAIQYFEARFMTQQQKRAPAIVPIALVLSQFFVEKSQHQLAIDRLETALGFARASSDKPYEAALLSALGEALMHRTTGAGDLRKAVDCLTAAHSIAVELEIVDLESRIKVLLDVAGRLVER
jgi:tetratricopeptide (TPR) repeat protein